MLASVFAIKMVQIEGPAGCPYPFVVDPAAPRDHDGNGPHCVYTYAELLDPFWAAFQLTFLVYFGIYGVPKVLARLSILSTSEARVAAGISYETLVRIHVMFLVICFGKLNETAHGSIRCWSDVYIHALF